jgi:histidinol-phosphate aminotransferase
MKDYLRENIRNIEPYQAEEPGGVRLDANENPFDLPDGLRAELLRADWKFNRYPDGGSTRLRQALGEKLGVLPDSVIVGNGSDELIQLLLLVYGGQGRGLLIHTPTFGMYKIAAAVTDTPLYTALLGDEGQSLPIDKMLEICKQETVSLIIVCNPNNPTGALFTKEDILRLAVKSDALVLVDEAYGEFAGVGASLLPEVGKYPGLMVMKTFSKAYGMAALRLGYLIAEPTRIKDLGKARQTYNVNEFSQQVGLAALGYADAYKKQIEILTKETQKLRRELAKLPGFKVWPTHANFFLFQPPDTGWDWAEALRASGFVVRNFSDLAGIGHCLRISAGTPEENEAFLRAVRTLSAVS